MLQFKEEMIPYTAEERKNKQDMRKYQRELNMACGKACSRCGNQANGEQNKAHARMLKKAELGMAKCKRCKRWL